MKRRETSDSESSDRSWFDKLTQFFSSEPRSRSDLMELLELARNNNLVDADAIRIFEGAIQVGTMQVREIMVPRSQMVVVKADDPLEAIIQPNGGTVTQRFYRVRLVP